MFRGLVLCHRLPDRTPCIHLFGKQRRLLCYRCCGTIVGLFIPWILWFTSLSFRNLIINQPLTGIVVLLFLFLPMGIDGLGQALGYWVSTNPRRFLTGLGGGVAQVILAMIGAGWILRLV